MVRTHSRVTVIDGGPMLLFKLLYIKKRDVISLLALIAAFAAIMPVPVSFASTKAISIFACEPEWAALSTEIGGETVSVYSATTASQDPHHIQARPSLIAKARKADMLICSGADLEIGWLPILLKKSGNPRIQPNSDGYLMATEHVELLGKIEKVTRSMGDVHGQGNPHIHLDPNRILKVAKVLAERLSNINPENNSIYRENLHQFQTEIDQMKSSNQKIIDTLRGKQWIVHHDNWIYLNEWLGLEQVETLEPKPGVPPTTRHLKKLINTVKSTNVNGVAYGSYQSPKAAKWLVNKTQLPLIAAPYTLSEWQTSGAIVKWYDELLKTLFNGLGK